jgi:hypothetical protein
VLRVFILPNGARIRAWYICDVKVKREHRGQHIPLLMVRRACWRYLQCRRWYFIAMNPPLESPQTIRIARHSIFSMVAQCTPINVYSIGSNTLMEQRALIERACKGRILFKSMKGKKEFDIFPPENSSEWKILHVQHGPHGDRETSDCVFPDPLPEHNNLIAAFANSTLDTELSSIEGVELIGTASLMYAGFDPSVVFGDTVLTNEI